MVLSAERQQHRDAGSEVSDVDSHLPAALLLATGHPGVSLMTPEILQVVSYLVINLPLLKPAGVESTDTFQKYNCVLGTRR